MTFDKGSGLLCQPTVFVCIMYMYMCRPQYSLSLNECEHLQARVKELQQQLAKKRRMLKMRGMSYDFIVMYLLIFPLTW